MFRYYRTMHVIYLYWDPVLDVAVVIVWLDALHFCEYFILQFFRYF